MEILLATTNLHKIREFKEMFKSLPHLELLSLHQFPNYVAPEENGCTFKENAILKAEHAARELNQWTIADDSGLIVPSLKGEPGIYSRRYAGPDASDAENRKKLLEAMKLLNSYERSAYFECCIALASPQGLKKCVEASCEGFIIEEQRGRNGFGYDSVFVKNDYDKTFAEIGESVKNRISHRRKAFERMATYMENLHVMSKQED
jgi:XTP/dITP diphosphohydrolase